jgi:hypothetical protein
MISYSAPDLSKHPPRSPRVKLGGFVHLPRLLDKARAAAVGQLGEFCFPCALDKRLIDFIGIPADTLLAQVKSGKSDSEMLAFINEAMSPKRSAWEIEAWSRWMESAGPGDAQRHSAFAEAITELAPAREDIRTTFDRLDLDDYTSFGGRG